MYYRWYLEASGTPIDELNGALALHWCDSRIDVFGYDVATVQQADGHVFAFAGVALYAPIRKVNKHTHTHTYKKWMSVLCTLFQFEKVKFPISISKKNRIARVGGNWKYEENVYFTLTIWLLGSKHADVISATLSCSW